MAGAWKRYRRIVVADQAFRWQAHFYDPYDYPPGLDHVVVRTEQRAHRVLIVRFTPGDVVGLVTPRRVRGFILHALARGWLRDHDALDVNNPDWFGPDNATAP
jgi:hypothetical protein